MVVDRWGDQGAREWGDSIKISRTFWWPITEFKTKLNNVSLSGLLRSSLPFIPGRLSCNTTNNNVPRTHHRASRIESFSWPWMLEGGSLLLRRRYALAQRRIYVGCRVVAERSSLPDSSSGVSSRMWVRIPVVTIVSLSKTLNHNCFVLRMGRKAVGPVCCVMHVMHVKEHL